jgi:hypothetical protein
MLEDLPRMQFHLFAPWTVDPNICQFCAQLPQAHPSPEALAEWEAEQARATSPAAQALGDGQEV